MFRLSQDTEAAALLKRNNFGMRADQISFVVQAAAAVTQEQLVPEQQHIVLPQPATSILYCRSGLPHGSTEV